MPVRTVPSPVGKYVQVGTEWVNAVALVGAGGTAVGTDTSPVVSRGANVEVAGLSAGALNQDLVPATDVSDYQSFSLHITGTFTGTLSFQGSNDNTNWASFGAMDSASVQSVSAISSSAGGLKFANINWKWMRVRMTAYTSGTATGVLLLDANAIAPLSLGVAAAITSTANTVNIGNTPNTTPILVTEATRLSGGLSIFKRIATGTTLDGAVVKVGAGQIYQIFCNNQNAAVRYLKLYNQTTAPTSGNTPVSTYAIPPNDNVNLVFFGGEAFSSGIAMALTTGVADNDNTSASANEHVVNIAYK